MARIVLIVLMLASCGIAQAQTVGLPGLLVYNAWVRPTAPEPAGDTTPEPPIPGTVTGAYLTIENTGDADYQLVGIDAGFAGMSMLHESSVDDQGVMRMRAVSGLDIPAGATVQLAPGRYHAMIMNVTHDIYPGQAVALTLTFADVDGATFDILVGALATDFPPEDDTLIAANALATPNADGGCDITVILNNRGVQDEALTDIIMNMDTAVGLAQNPLLSKIPSLPLDIPAGDAFAFQPDDIFIVIDLALAPGDAFPLTLTFASGESITVAVPITELPS